MNTLVWRQQTVSTLNYLCTMSNCYSTCAVKCSIGSVFARLPRQLSSCSKCNHAHWNHFHLRSTWVQVQAAQPMVDDNTRKQWEAAKDQKAKTAALDAISKRALEDLTRIKDDALDELTRCAAEYASLASLSLSGSFSPPLEKAIRLLEQRCRGMGVDSEQLAKGRESSEQMKDRLAGFGQAKEKVREGDRKVEGKVPGGVWKVQGQEEAQEGARKVEEVRGGVSNREREIQQGARTVLGSFWEKIREKVREKVRQSLEYGCLG